MAKGVQRGTATACSRLHFFDEHPVKLPGFTLMGRAVEPVGRPTLAQWAAALDFAAGAEVSAPFWVGDLWNYGEGRDDWRDQLEQAVTHRMTRQTLIHYGWISRKVVGAARALAPSARHAEVVAALDPVEQTKWLEKAKTEEMPVRDLQLEVRAAKRRKVIEGQATLEGMFRVIYADCPWTYGDRPPSGSGAGEHYGGMTIEELCRLPVEAHAMPNSVLFFWVTAPMLFENPGPREVIDAWGFTPKTQRIWNKVNHNFGHYFSVQHEILIVATRGSCLPDRPTPMLPSVVTERPSGEHSEKPESFRRDIERLYDGPYLELFGREPREGWTVFGNDARLWAQEAAAV